MANSLQARKRARQSVARYKINHSRLMRIRTYIRRVEKEIARGDGTTANTALRKAQSEMMRGVNKGLLHKGTVARKVARLNRRIKLLAA